MEKNLETLPPHLGCDFKAAVVPLPHLGLSSNLSPRQHRGPLAQVLTQRQDGSVGGLLP